MESAMIGKSGLVLGFLIGVLLTASACCGPSVAKPAIGYVPEGWQLVDENPYGAYDLDGVKLGSLLYEDATGANFVIIVYGDIPNWVTSGDADRYDPIARLVGATTVFDAGETGVMTVGGRSASYFRACKGYICELGLSFFKVSGWSVATTWIGIYTAFTQASEDEAMSLIDSISF